MLFWWKIRYLDTNERQFKDREVWLDSTTLDLLTRVAVEATYDLKEVGRGREMLRYRHLFQERDQTDHERQVLWFEQGGRGAILITNYFEDEAGQELTPKRMGAVLIGDPNVAFFPAGTQPHDAEFALAEKPPINLDAVTLSQEELMILGIFVRDLRELLSTAFFKNGPGSLSGAPGGSNWSLKTAVTDEEIRSFVTIFRRLYMDKEPANFVKAIAVTSRALQVHPVAKWIQGITGEYEKAFEAKPELIPLITQGELSFTRKRLIDVFLYTQYAHQPDERRTRQFHECLASVGGNRSVLTWLFFTEVWKSAIQIRNAGVVVADFYDRYCECHCVTCGVLPSVRSDHPGIGVLEKKEAQEARVIREKAEELATALWMSAGRPEGGHTPYIKQATEQLMAAIRRPEIDRD